MLLPDRACSSATGAQAPSITSGPPWLCITAHYAELSRKKRIGVRDNVTVHTLEAASDSICPLDLLQGAPCSANMLLRCSCCSARYDSSVRRVTIVHKPQQDRKLVHRAQCFCSSSQCCTIHSSGTPHKGCRICHRFLLVHPPPRMRATWPVW